MFLFQCREVHNADDQCGFILNTSSCEIEGLIDYNAFVYCDFSSAPWAGMLILVSPIQDLFMLMLCSRNRATKVYTYMRMATKTSTNEECFFVCDFCRLMCT